MLAAPSLLPGWSRGHVVAHLALNAEGFTRALRTKDDAQPQPVYDSDEARNGDIDALAAEGTAAISRLESAVDELAEALAASDGLGTVERIPGGPTFEVADLVVTRRREVEVHHADLGLSYTAHDWPADFAAAMLDLVTTDQADAGPFTVEATDLDRRWQVGGEGGPVVRGRAGELGWWLSGRPAVGLEGDLPELGAWTRRGR